MKVSFPLITNYLFVSNKDPNTNLSTSEATDRNDHDVLIDRKTNKMQCLFGEKKLELS